METPFELDTRNPVHAKAYLRAASFFLSGWPQEWSAETLALALVDEENPNQKRVLLWNPLKNNCGHWKDPFLYADQMICDLAESFLEFLEENS